LQGLLTFTDRAGLDGETVYTLSQGVSVNENQIASTRPALAA
jgi:hypothetical protein